MTTMRRLVSTLLSTGVLSAGRSPILTGLAFLVVGWALVSVSPDDAAAGGVSVVAFAAGVWQVQRGVRSQLQRRRPRPGADT
jgi:protein-S-isoprenylcysteine O-methyltransferase Ste14